MGGQPPIWWSWAIACSAGGTFRFFVGELGRKPLELSDFAHPELLPRPQSPHSSLQRYPLKGQWAVPEFPRGARSYSGGVGREAGRRYSVV